MDSLIATFITGTGLIAAIGIVIKFLISSMGKHVDRLVAAFEKQTDRVMGELGEVKVLSEKNAKRNRKEHNLIFESLKKDDERHEKITQELLVAKEEIEKIPCKFNEFKGSPEMRSLYACEHDFVKKEPTNGNNT